MTRKTLAVLCVLAGMVVGVALGSQLSSAVAAVAAPISSPTSFAPLVVEVGPAVVNINVKLARPAAAADPDSDPASDGLGTGFLISSDGYILTNDHVVGAATAIQVVLSDGRELPGRVIGSDARTDIALVKIDDKRPFPAVRLGDSDRAEIGEWVVAIGNPFGLDHTVTAGIISAKGRRNVHPSGRRGLYDFIQTDASINPGNSGGPLINVAGEVIGINAATSQGQGIGFAIPINMAKTLLPMLKEHGHVQRSYLGVSIQDLTHDLAASLHLPDANGALITAVVAGSPAAKAGLATGDVVIVFDGKPIHNAEELTWLTSVTGAGKAVGLGVVRNGAQRQLSATLGDAPDETALAKPRLPISEPRLGLDVAPVSADIARELGLDEIAGVVVVGIDRGSPIAGVLARGDVILAVNDRAVNDEADLVEATQDLQSGAIVRLRIIRQGTPMWLAFNLS